MIFQLLVFVYFVTTAFSSPIGPHLVCEEKKWQNILTFFATNYIAHAFTIIPDPGANWIAQTVFSFSALMVPNIGLVGAIGSVMSYFLQGRSDDLHRALAQNALVILVKKDDIRAGDMEIDIKTNKKLNSRQVHGKITIPDGYTLIVPYQPRRLDEMKPALRESKGIKLCRSKELASAFVGIAQVIFASITIYRARGDQIEKYGYAAYGFSVYPYLLMSLANLIKLLACGRYPYAYVLRTATLAEAVKDGGVFEGAVGNPKEDGKAVDDSQGGGSMGRSDPPFWIKYPFMTFKLAGNYGIRRRSIHNYGIYRLMVPTIGVLIFLFAIISQPLFVFLLNGFNTSYNSRGQKIWTPKAGQSTRAQRFWMLGWVFANMYSAPLVHFVASSGHGFGGRNARYRVSCVSYVLVIFAFVFAVGGFVTVGGMLHAESSYQPC